MTDINEARELIYDHVRDNWTQTVFGFDGDRFNPPDGEYIFVSVRSRGGGQSTLGGVGNRRYRRESAVIAQVFVPVGQGLQRNDVLAKAFRDLFEGSRVGPNGELEFFDGVIRELGPTGKHNQHNVEIEFSYQERK